MSSNVDRMAEARTADAIAWKLRGFKLEQTTYAMPGRTAAAAVVAKREDLLDIAASSFGGPVQRSTSARGDDTVHRIDVTVGHQHTSIDVMGVTVVDGWPRNMLLRLRHAGVDMDVSIHISESLEWYPILGFVNPRLGGINAVETACEGIRPILTVLARGMGIWWR